MKIRFILGSILIGLTFALISCDDNLGSVGESIQPENDKIILKTDTFNFTAQTIKWDSIYAKTSSGLLGEYEEPVFGKIKSDYLSEFYCDKETRFLNKVNSIDSVTIDIYVKSYIGDTISPIGLSAYKVTKNLERDFYTNIDPKDYCDMSVVLGRNLFSISDIKWNYRLKRITFKVDKNIGQDIYNKWLNDSTTFQNINSLRKYLPGVYITQTFGTDLLMNVEHTMLNVNYTYVGRNYNNTKDSIRPALFQLANTAEVIQMNHVNNSNTGKLLEEGSPKRTYIKTPAGVYTELTIPLSEIANKVEKGYSVNSATIVLKGFTEEDQFSKFPRPKNLLLIPKDSVNSFFLKKDKKLANNTTSFIISYSANTNSYNLNNISQYNNISYGTIQKMINYYLNKYRDENLSTIPDLKYVLIPVEIKTIIIPTNYGNVIELKSVSNLMEPTSAILRTDEDNMKFQIVYSKYRDR